MIIGINSLSQIKQIREITDITLMTVELDETAEKYPFNGWTDTRILCYCYKVDEHGVSIYPYIDTNLIEKLEHQEIERLKLQEIIDIMLGGAE